MYFYFRVNVRCSKVRCPEVKFNPKNMHRGTSVKNLGLVSMNYEVLVAVPVFEAVVVMLTTLVEVTVTV